LPRRVYDDYLQDLLFWHTQPLSGPGRVHIELVDDEAVHQIAQAFLADEEQGRADWRPTTPANLIEYCI